MDSAASSSRFLRSARRLAAVTLAGAGALALSPAATPAATPLDGNGMWIWYVSQSGGGAKAIAAKAKRHDVSTVLVKSGDAGNYWGQFSAKLVGNLKQRGIGVCAWQFVYGSSPVAEARVGAAAKRAGADCLVIDAESAYEGRYGAAERYVEELRERVGRSFPLALSSFPYVDYHPWFPYSVFLGRGAATMNAPQVYWRAIGTTVRAAYEHTYRFNRPYGRAIFPIGQTWQNPPSSELVAFRKYGREFGARGVSWWSWQETGGNEWDAIGRPLRRGVPGYDAKRVFAAVGVGARGDLVIHAQLLLRAAGKRVSVDGTYGSGVARKVRSVQEENGLAVTGTVDGPTWRVLLRSEPARANWSERGSPRAAVRARPLAPELPSTPGRP